MKSLLPKHLSLSLALTAWALIPVFPPSPYAAASLSSRFVTIGILTDAMVPWHTTTTGFRDGLRALGYVEGQNVRFEARAAQGDAGQLNKFASELLKHKPDLLFCVADACFKGNKDTPMVFAQVSDPVKLGLVESVARPGGNITGIANLRAELSAKRLELFKELVPSLRRVLLTFDPRKSEEGAGLLSARKEANRLKMKLIENAITEPLEIESRLAELEQGGRDGILIVQSGTNLNIPARSLQVATSNKIPTMYPASFWSQVGALASYGPDQYTQGQQAARLAQRVLTGTHPRDLPVELPDRIEFVVNLKTAKGLGLQVPKSVLYRANRVIK